MITVRHCVVCEQKFAGDGPSETACSSACADKLRPPDGCYDSESVRLATHQAVVRIMRSPRGHPKGPSPIAKALTEIRDEIRRMLEDGRRRRSAS